MPEPLVSSIAGKLAGPVVGAIGRRLSSHVLGPEEARAVEAAVRSATSAVVAEFDDELDADAPVWVLGHSRVVALLVDAAFRGQPVDDSLESELVDLGYDPVTSPVDLVGVAVELTARLREEIRREAEKHDSRLFNRLVLASIDDLAESRDSQGSSGVSFLPPVPNLVVGRTGDVRRLRTRALDEPAARAVMRVTSVRGWPGVGKSTMLALLANDQEIRRSFPGGVLWAAVSQSSEVHPHLIAWLRQLGSVPDPAMPAGLLSRQLAATLQDRRVLLLVDDVWQVADAQPLLVGGERCAGMLTTRFTDVALALATTPNDVYVLGVLDEADGLRLLQRLAPAVVRRHRADCATLVAELEGLPLALQVAGRLLAAEEVRGWGVSDLIEELREGATLLAATAPADRADVANATTPTVATLLTRSTSRLSELDREHFAFLGAFAEKPATFDLAAIAAVWAVGDPRPGVRVLADRGLLEPVGGGRFTMHALLAMHARDLLGGHGG